MEEQIKDIMSELFRIDKAKIADETSNHAVEAWDSLKHMELIVSLEDTFEITLTADEIVSMTTYAKIRRVVQEKKNGS